MPESEQTKVCPLCAETIKAAAKVCPYCQSRQSRFALWKQELGGVIGVLFCVGILIWVGACVLPDDKRPDYSKFVRHRDELDVVRVLVERDQKKQELWVSGCVTNKGSYSWRVHELEVRFLDDRDNLLNVLHPQCESPFVVQPGHESAFKVSLNASTYTNAVPKYIVRVQSATDGNEKFDFD